MPFITEGNLNRIINRIDFNSQTFNGKIWKHSIFFLTREYSQKILATKYFMKDPQGFFNQYYSKLQIEDRGKYIFEGGRPAYHLTQDCERLNSNFTNYELPPSLKFGRAEKIEEYRAWFKNNLKLLEEDKESFRKESFRNFRINYLPIPVSVKNTGSVGIDNLDLNILEREIDNLIYKASSYFEKDNRYYVVLRQFSKYAYLNTRTEKIENNRTGLSDEEVKYILKEFYENITSPFLKKLKSYFMVKYNPELIFEGNLLKQLGFIQCRNCYVEK